MGYDTHALFLCAVRTGMRLGELFGSQWPDLDFNSRFIQVQRNWVRGRIETPKNNQPRRIDINEEGQRPDQNNWRRRVFEKVLEKAKLRRITPHDIRHCLLRCYCNKVTAVRERTNGASLHPGNRGYQWPSDTGQQQASCRSARRNAGRGHRDSIENGSWSPQRSPQ
ncbi:MAG: hypothetical protein DMG16_11790 [Acidobacteria bacterium]|nr:MAG: hypothetical protein DMG16_11790 [Acidobacteriota bacterium]